MALLKVEHALQLSLEESRLLQQRERELRKQLKLVRKTAGEKADELRAQLSASERSVDGLKARINTFASTLVHLKERNIQQAAQTRALRDEFAAKLSTAQAQLRTAVEAEATACAVARKARASTVRDLQWRNESLRQRNGVLEDRVRVLEIAQSACKLHKTAL